MSYCRWSSDNYNSDLYCFQHVDGWWQTYVADFRHRSWLRLFHWLTDRRYHSEHRDGYSFRITRFNLLNWPHWLTHKPIRHPWAGESYQDTSEEAMFRRILKLHSEGFKVPKRLMKEIHEHQGSS